MKATVLGNALPAPTSEATKGNMALGGAQSATWRPEIGRSSTKGEHGWEPGAYSRS